MSAPTTGDFDIEIEQAGPLRLGEYADSLSGPFEEPSRRPVDLVEGGRELIVVDDNAVARSQII